MQTSRIIEIEGIFVGAAMLAGDGETWCFKAADSRTSAAEGAVAGSLADLETMARRAFFTSRLNTPGLTAS